MNMPHAESFRTKTGKKIFAGFQVPGNLKSHPLLKIFLGVLLLLAVGFAGNEMYRKLCCSDFFQITEVTINGNRMASKEQISSLSRVDIHSNLLAINTGQVKSLLQSHPWIANAQIKRNWPNRLLINITEKKPVALLSTDSGLHYLDRKGHLIAAAENSQDLDFPVISGLDNLPSDTDHPGNNSVLLQEAMEFLRLAAMNSTILPRQNISEIHISDKGKLKLFLLEKAFPIHLGGEGKISTRYYRLVRVLRDLYKTREFSKVSYIRLDYQKDTILVGKAERDSNHRG